MKNCLSDRDQQAREEMKRDENNFHKKNTFVPRKKKIHFFLILSNSIHGI